MTTTQENTTPYAAATTTLAPVPTSQSNSLSKRSILALALVFTICGVIIITALIWRILYIHCHKHSKDEGNIRYTLAESHASKIERLVGQRQIKTGNGSSSLKRWTWTWGTKVGGGEWAKFGGVSRTKGRGRKEIVIGKPYNFRRCGGAGDKEIISERTSLSGRIPRGEFL